VVFKIVVEGTLLKESESREEVLLLVVIDAASSSVAMGSPVDNECYLKNQKSKHISKYNEIPCNLSEFPISAPCMTAGIE
jgi:hypothetical protein